MIAAVVGPFAEAVRATTQPCTFLLVVPTLAAVVAARANWRSLVTAVAAAVVGGWLLAANTFLLDGGWLQLSAVGVVVAMAVLAAPLVRRTGVPGYLTAPWVQAGIVAFVVFVASQWWRPCVGRELGAILTSAQGGMGGQLLPMAAYVLGAMVPVIAVVALRYAIDPGMRAQLVVATGGALVGVVVAAFLVAGRHESVTITLTRWTLG